MLLLPSRGRRGVFALGLTTLCWGGCADYPVSSADLPALEADEPLAQQVSTRADDDAPAVYPRIEAAQIPSPPVLVKNGFKLAESPIWDTCNDHLYFTDVDRNVINQMSPSGVISQLMGTANFANGMALHHDGSLILAQMGGGKGGRIARRAPDGTVTVLTDVNATGGKYRTPDDVVVRSDGTIFFSDADFTHGPYSSINTGSRPVYILKPGAKSVIKGPSVRGPNGIELSPDEKVLYVSAYFNDAVYKYAVAADGSLTAAGTLAGRMNKSDSLCLDAAGNAYVGTEDGLQVVRPDGTKVKLLPIRSADGTTNCTFGGADGRTLYITSFEALWKVEKMPIPGLDYVRHQKLRTCGED